MKDPGVVRKTVTTSRKMRKTRVNRKRGKTINRAGRICVTYCSFPLVRKVAKGLGMPESSERHPWNVMWMDKYPTMDMCRRLHRYQRINHFLGITDISRKNSLAAQLCRARKLYPEEYNFAPKSWCLPTQYDLLLDHSNKHPSKIFIFKPNTGCEGRGIYITNNVKSFEGVDKMIAQEYIWNPLLIDGFKFDLRLYVLISSCNPLRVYVYNEGLARFATRPYHPSLSNLKDHFMHLTNYSVNKTSETYQSDDLDGSKRKLSTIYMLLQREGYDVESILTEMDDIIIKTVLLAVPKMKYLYKKCFPSHTDTLASFELLGFDFILSSSMVPILLETNRTPSLAVHAGIDQEVKEPLIYDTFNLLNLAKDDKYRVSLDEKVKRQTRKIGDGDAAKVGLRLRRTQKWEEAHTGNYRLLYPSHDPKYKRLLIGLENKFRAPPSPAKQNPQKKTQSEHIFDRRTLVITHQVLEGLQKRLQIVEKLRVQDEILNSRSNNWIQSNESLYQRELRKLFIIISKLSQSDKLSSEAKEKLTIIHNKAKINMDLVFREEDKKRGPKGSRREVMGRK